MIGLRVETQTESAPGARRAGRLQDLYLQHAPAATRLAYFLTGDRELAQDLVQDAFVKVAGRFQHLRVPDAFDAYLRRTIVNLFTSHLRRRRLERLELRRQRSAREREQRDVDFAERDAMWTALQGLPTRQRAAVVLRYYEDLSERQIAEILRCRPGTVKSLLSRAIQGLRGEVGGELDE